MIEPSSLLSASLNQPRFSMSAYASEVLQSRFGSVQVTVNRKTGQIVQSKTILNPKIKPPITIDPDLEFACNKIRDSGLSPEAIEARCESLGRPVSRYAILGWLHGGVKRPQNFTLTTVMIALGFEKQWNKKTN